MHRRFQVGDRILIRSFPGNTEYGEVVIDTGTSYDIDFQRQPDETYSICAD